MTWLHANNKSADQRKPDYNKSADPWLHANNKNANQCKLDLVACYNKSADQRKLDSVACEQIKRRSA